MSSTVRVTIFVLSGALFVGLAAVARPSKEKSCNVQLELPGILADEPRASAPAAPVDLTPALQRGLRLAQLESPELLADLTIGLPEGFALHGGSVIELNRALTEGRFRGAIPNSTKLSKVVPLVAEEDLEAVASSRFFSVLTSADIAAEAGDAALIEIPKSLAKSAAVGARVLGLRRAKSEKFDALAPVLENLTTSVGPYLTLREASRHRSVDLETRKLIEDYLRFYRDPSRWTLENATLREGVLFVFKSSALRGKITLEDPFEVGTLLALGRQQGLSLDDLWAVIPLSKYDRTDLIEALPEYEAAFSAKRASSRPAPR